MSIEDTEKMIEVMQAFADGKLIEVTESGYCEYWSDTAFPAWSWSTHDYRVKAETPDSIDWSHVAPEFKYMVRDSDGEGWVCVDRPRLERHNGRWICSELGDGDTASVMALASYKRGTVDWKDSLIERPK